MASVRETPQAEGGRAPAWPPEAVEARASYEKRLRDSARVGAGSGPSVALHVFSFSSEHDLPEQVASLRSFLANVGTPAEFTIVSDGTHSEARVALLRALHGCVSVVPWDRLVNRGLPRAVWRYVEHGRGGKAGRWAGSSRPWSRFRTIDRCSTQTATFCSSPPHRSFGS
jgi:hypothetical protein